MDVHQKFSTLKKKKQSNWIIEESIADNIKIKKVIEVSVARKYVEL